MLSHIINFSLKNKLIVLLFTVFIIGYGLFALSQIPIGAVPDVTNNQVQVITTSRNLSTFDSDQDDNSGNCSTYYNNNPWFYGSCWSGNYFAGGGHVDGPYWNGSSNGDHHAYGAVYKK